MAKLNMDWNLRLNKKKSEILTSESLQEIGGVRCTKMVKYLGVKVTADRKELTRRGDLLAFADDMLVMSNCQHEINEVIEELAKLNMDWNLRLNKKKSEILTSESLQEIGGVRCTKVVKYLGVKVTADKKEQTKVARE